jgi:hypothetical protein
VREPDLCESDLKDSSVLARYLRQVTFKFSAASTQGISVLPRSESFKESIRDLIQRICKKMRHYQWPKGDDVRLLTFYLQGWEHNSPIYSPLSANAEKAAEWLGAQADVPFKHVYLFFWGMREAYEIYPRLARCV